MKELYAWLRHRILFWLPVRPSQNQKACPQDCDDEGIVWVPFIFLNEFISGQYFGTGYSNKPDIFQDPSGTDTPISDWYDLLVQTAEWLVRKGLVMHHDPANSARLMEEQADRFAGEFLAPARELKTQLWGLDFQKLAGLKQYWKISIQSLIMRAFHLGVISERQRRNMFMRINKAGYRMWEPLELDPALEPPSMPYRLIQFHKTFLEYNEEDIQELLGIYTDDMRVFYRDPQDYLASLR